MKAKTDKGDYPFKVSLYFYKENSQQKEYLISHGKHELLINFKKNHTQVYNLKKNTINLKVMIQIKNK